MNKIPEAVWVTHWDTEAWGTYLSGVSEKPWEASYDAPVTKYASNTKYVPAQAYEDLKRQLERMINLAEDRLMIILGIGEEDVKTVSLFEKRNKIS